tara:strand:+ start:3857 stop:5365 length:1509 start_codon:yes stop_codon:yes gene_type:complete
MKYVEHILDRFTMYQVLTFVLLTYVVWAFLLSVFGMLSYNLSALLLSAVVIMAVVVVVHYLLTLLTKAPGNIWSSVITGLILFLLFTPTTDSSGLAVLAGLAALSVAGKYIVRYRNVHLVNPIVLTAVIASISGLAYASWWVGTAWFTPLLMVGGLIVTIKVRRMPMVLAGVLASLLMVSIYAVIRDSVSASMFNGLLFTSPLWFFMTVMVTEPLSTPAGERAQILYGIFIGLLSQMPFSIGPLYNSPEFSLMVANLLVWPLSLRGRLKLTCLKVTEVAHNTLEYVFRPSFPVSFQAGQYLEWALPHQSPDGRGTRRYFTIASSPTRKNVRLVVRTEDKGSSYKETLKNFQRGDIIQATQLAGDFVLPKDAANTKLVFVAGGIGVTPFLSQLEYLKDTKQKTDIVLFYCNRTVEDIAYAQLFKAYESIGVRTVHILAEPDADWSGEFGYLSPHMLRHYTPDLIERIVYLSGPPGMVTAYKKLFTDCGVSKRHIKTDYFPGLA